MKLEVDKLKLGIAAVAVGLSLSVPLWVISTPAAIKLVKTWGYWGMSLIFLIFLFSVWTSLQRLRGLKIRTIPARKHLPGITLILIGTVFLNTQDKNGFKILFDEHVLSATAYSMHNSQMAYAQSAVHVLSEENRPSIGYVDKRPLLFPYLLSLIHNLLGYDIANAFLFNTVLCTLLLSLTYATVARFCGTLHALVPLLLLLGLPLLAQNTNGGGYELLNLCLIVALVLSGAAYLSNESPTTGLNLNVMTAILLANVRYESMLYVLVPALLFLIKTLRTKKARITWLSALSPLLLIIPLLNYAIFQDEPRFMQTTEDNFFSLNHLGGNFSGAVRYLSNLQGDYTNSASLSLLGIVAIFVFLLHVATHPSKCLFKDTITASSLVVLTVAAANTFLALTHYWGDWTDPLTSRFSLPLHWFMAFCVPLALKKYLNTDNALLILIGIAGIQLIFVAPKHNLRMATEVRLPNSRGYNWAMQWIENSAPSGNHLYLAPSSIGLGLLGSGTIPLKAANLMPERVIRLKDLGVYDEIFAFQALAKNAEGSTTPLSRMNALNSRYVLETLEQLHLNDKVLYRMSRVTALNPPTHDNKTLPKYLPQILPPGTQIKQLEGADLYRLLPLAP